MVSTIDFKYDDTDIISDTIINFYESLSDRSVLSGFIELYTNDKNFFNYIQKNFLINKMSSSYLLRLYNDYDGDDIVESFDTIDYVNTTRWI